MSARRSHRREWLDALIASARRERAEETEAARREWRQRVREATLAGDAEGLRKVVEEGRVRGWAQ